MKVADAPSLNTSTVFARSLLSHIQALLKYSMLP